MTINSLPKTTFSSQLTCVISPTMTPSATICVEGHTLSSEQCQLALALTSHMQTARGALALEIGHPSFLPTQSHATFLAEIMKNATDLRTPLPFTVILPALMNPKDGQLEEVLDAVHDHPKEWEARAAKALAQWARKKADALSR